MDKSILNKILFAGSGAGRDMTITVSGISMNPAMREGDTVTIRKSDTYNVGDVLVFLYKGELLIHRLLKIEKNKYFCKGDNSFRLEDITADSIAGRVILHNGKPLLPPPDYLISLSYLVNRAFRKCGYDPQKAKQTKIYKFYRQIFMKDEEKTMLYQKNNQMDYIQSDETSLAVFDPETGNTHFFDETGIDILNCLEEPCDLDTLLERLCNIYNASPEEIKADVEEFLAMTVSKGVVALS